MCILYTQPPIHTPTPQGCGCDIIFSHIIFSPYNQFLTLEWIIVSCVGFSTIPYKRHLLMALVENLQDHSVPLGVVQVVVVLFILVISFTSNQKTTGEDVCPRPRTHVLLLLRDMKYN